MIWPRWFSGLRARLGAILGFRHADDDLENEMSFHVAVQTQENLRRGMSEQEAVRHARITLGGVDQTKECVREGRPFHMLATLSQDARYALRVIRRTPGFAAVTVITIGLGVGANTAIFSVVNGVLLRPLPYAEPDRLVRVYLVNPPQEIADGRLSVPEIDDWRTRSRSLASIAGAVSIPMILTGQGDPTEHQAAIVAGDLFGTLGVPARIGRVLTEEDLRQAIPNAVISDRLWATRFGRDHAILGRRIVMGNLTSTVVGVMPPEFRYPASDTDFWVAESVLPVDALGPRVRSQRQFEGLARIRAGVTMEQVQNDINVVAAQLASEFPGTNKGWSALDGGPLRAANCLVSPGYMRTMRIPLIRGDPMPESWPEGAPFPFLVSEAAARRFWPGEDPVGQIVRANYGGRAIVVGIVGDVRQHGLIEDPPPVVYFNQRTAPRIVTTVVLRTAGDPLALSGAVRGVVRELDPNQPIRSIVPLTKVMSESIARDRFFTLLFGLFGSLALVLAAVGVYGVLAYSVGQRTREIGVRMALGARVGDVLRMVLREGMLLVLAGIGLGAVASLALMRVLRSQLHGISVTDPLTFVAAPAVLAAVALVACYVPAWRATRIHPVTALRAE